MDTDLHATTEQHVNTADQCQTACFAIEIDIATSKTSLKKFLHDPAPYVVSQMRRRAVEIQERRLTDQKLAQFRAAKDKEIKSHIKSQRFKILPPEMRDRAHDAVAWRWILTWKAQPDENSPPKAKARALILGYQGKSYEHKATTSPTLSRNRRQAVLAFCALCVASL